MAFKSEPNDSIVDKLAITREFMSGEWLDLKDDNEVHAWVKGTDLDRLIELAGYGLAHVKFVEATAEAADRIKKIDDPRMAFKKHA
jgi:hypothetical protein